MGRCVQLQQLLDDVIMEAVIFCFWLVSYKVIAFIDFAHVRSAHGTFILVFFGASGIIWLRVECIVVFTGS